MNILTEEQAASRGLSLPAGGLLTDVPQDFIAELQVNGTFIEYNQQVIAAAGEPIDYILCVVAGQATLARRDNNYAKARIGSIGAGQWFGEASLFVPAPMQEELFADGEVIVWSVAPETLRDLFFRMPASVQLLLNIATGLAQKLSTRGDESVATKTQS